MPVCSEPLQTERWAVSRKGPSAVGQNNLQRWHMKLRRQVQQLAQWWAARLSDPRSLSCQCLMRVQSQGRWPHRSRIQQRIRQHLPGPPPVREPILAPELDHAHRASTRDRFLPLPLRRHLRTAAVRSSRRTFPHRRFQLHSWHTTCDLPLRPAWLSDMHSIVSIEISYALHCRVREGGWRLKCCPIS